MAKLHTYKISLSWTGNTGSGTSTYGGYERSFEVAADSKPTIAGSSDPAFRGDRSRWNPEELLVASLSACHKLWYLHLCAEAGICLTAYTDDAEGTMEESAEGGERFTHVILRPQVTIAHHGKIGQARAIHSVAHQKCFIANSVSFPVSCRPTVAGGAEQAL